MPKFEIKVETSDATTASEVLSILEDAVEQDELPITHVSMTHDIVSPSNGGDDDTNHVLTHGAW